MGGGFNQRMRYVGAPFAVSGDGFERGPGGFQRRRDAEKPEASGKPLGSGEAACVLANGGSMSPVACAPPAAKLIVRVFRSCVDPRRRSV